MVNPSTTPEIGGKRSVPNPGEIDLLIEHLTDFEENKRLTAARRLGTLHDKRAVQTLIGRLYIDGSASVRQAAVEALYAINDAIAWPEIAKVLKQDDDSEVRSKAAEILGLSGDKTQAAPLLEALQDRDPKVREQASIGIGKLQNTSIITGLLAGLTQLDGQVKQFESGYIDALVALNGWEVVDAILKSAEACNDASGGYRPDTDKCIYELQKVTPHGYSSYALTTFYNSRIDVLQRVRQVRVDHKTAKAPVLVIAVRALEKFQGQASIQLLSQVVLTYREPAIRWLALQSLQQLKASTSGDSLQKVLSEDTDWIVRKKAAEVLGDLQIQTANNLLCEKALTDSETQVRRQAIRAIGQLASMTSLPTLSQLIQTSADEETRLLACEALAELKSKEVIRPLSSAVGTDRSTRVRQKAAEALGSVGERDALPFLAQVMQKETESPEVRMAAMAATAKLGDGKAVDELWKMILVSEFSLHVSIVHHLVNIKTEKSTINLIKVLQEINATANYNYSGPYRDVNLHHLAINELVMRPTASTKDCFIGIVCANPHAFDEYVTKSSIDALMKTDQRQAFHAFVKAIEATVNLNHIVDGISRLEGKMIGSEMYAVLADIILNQCENYGLVRTAISILKNIDSIGKKAASQKLLKFLYNRNLDRKYYENSRKVVVCIDALTEMRYRDSYRGIQIVAGLPDKYDYNEVKREARRALEKLKKEGEPLPSRGLLDFEPYWTP